MVQRAVCIHNLYRTKDDIDLGRLLHSRTPAFIGFDINAHHLLWHTKSNREGHKIIEQLERLDDYVILNEIQQATTTYKTAIDITVAHASLAARSKWEVMSTLASDHFGICTTLYTKDVPPVQHQPRWLLNRADWPAFQSKVT